MLRSTGVRAVLGVGLSVVVVGFLGWLAAPVEANHPVLVEGEKDFDGDGLIGAAEDTDNDTDRIFGTITAALGMANGGANQNGRVTIVTSGRFPEVVTITAANGNVTLEAAPGVDANVDAVLAGNPDNATRQGQPGIIVNSPANRMVIIRNIASVNWTEGIQVLGSSRVVIDDCAIENNRDYGIHVVENATVTISRCLVAGTGFRSGSMPVDNTPNPGIGIEFEDRSKGTISSTIVSGSFGTGFAKGRRTSVRRLNVTITENDASASAGN